MEIQDLYTPSRRNGILMVGAAIAFLSPFTDTIYLPALSSVGDSLHASDAAVAATVSAYLGSCGLGQLLWGPLSDHFGRLNVLYLSLFLFLLFTVGCIFANSIIILIILRSLEGFIVGSTVVTVQAIIADIYPVEELGQAMGSLLVFLKIIELSIFFRVYFNPDTIICFTIL
jgi:MFS transporter, DHA1 family, multidrug resistance protein